MAETSSTANANSIVDFGWLGSLFGVVMSTFSIATLVHYGVVTGELSRPIDALVSAYHDTIGVVFVPLERLLLPWLQWVSEAMGLDINLHPHWRHILLLSLVFWLSWGRAYWRVDRGKTAAVVLVGLAFSASAAIGAGSLTLGGSLDVMIFALPAAAAFLAFELMVSITAIVPRVRFLDLWIFAILTGLVALIYFWGPTITHAVSGPDSTVRSPALLVLVLAGVFLGIGGLGLGAGLALFRRPKGEGWLSALRRNPDFRVGVIMLGGFFGAAILFAVDAALKLSAQ